MSVELKTFYSIHSFIKYSAFAISGTEVNSRNTELKFPSRHSRSYLSILHHHICKLHSNNSFLFSTSFLASQWLNTFFKKEKKDRWDEREIERDTIPFKELIIQFAVKVKVV